MCKVYTVPTHRFLHDLAPAHFSRLTFCHSFSYTLSPSHAFLLVVPRTHTKLIPASGSLYLLFSLLPYTLVAHSLTSFRSLLKCTSLKRPSLTKLSTKPSPPVYILCFLEWFEVHRKIEQKMQKFPIYNPAFICAQLLLPSTSPMRVVQCERINELKLTHQYNPKSIVYIRVHSGC